MKKLLYVFFTVSLLGTLLFSTANLQAKDTQNSDPLETMAGYLQALQSGKRDNLFPYLNGKSLSMMQKRPYSESMMQLEASSIVGCGLPRTLTEEKRAVVHFPDGAGKCSPYFMEYQKGFWRLDLYTMSQVIRFDTGNQWHMDMTAEHPYRFAFTRKKKHNDN